MIDWTASVTRAIDDAMARVWAALGVKPPEPPTREQLLARAGKATAKPSPAKTTQRRRAANHRARTARRTGRR